MTKDEIIKQSCKGIVIDADNLDDLYEVYDANKLYILTIDKVCDYLKEHIDEKLTIYHQETWCSLEQFITLLKDRLYNE